MQLIQEYDLLAGFAIAGFAILIGLVVSRAGRGRLRREAAGLRTQLNHVENLAQEQNRTLVNMRNERSPVADLARSLPSIVSELNSEKLDTKKVPSLVCQLAKAVFQPEQCLYYAVRWDSAESRALELVAGYGLKKVPEELRRIRFGHGKIGWVAEHQTEMARTDWHNPTRTGGTKTIEDNHRALEPDIMGVVTGPRMQHGGAEKEVIGVLSLGVPGVEHAQDERHMFQLVTSLGSMAIVNSEFRAHLRTQANHDGLTGLLNKRFFMQELAKMLYESSTDRTDRQAPLSVFIFDIDHFKTYNDTNGHPAGDDLLRRLSTLLKDINRPDDMVCRYGGEEFMIAMPDTEGPEAIENAERIRVAIETTEFRHQKKQPSGNLTISGGVASFPMDGNEVATLVQLADESLYESKKGGRNRVTLHRGVQIGDGDDATNVDLQPTAQGQNLER